MTLFGGFFTIVICAAMAAWFAGRLPSSKPADVEFGEDRNFSDPGAKVNQGILDLVENEQFYRNFIINLAFGAITLATAGVIFRNQFFDIGNAVFYVVLNLTVVLVNVSELKDDPRPLKPDRRKKKNRILTASLVILFVTGMASGGWANLLNCFQNSSGPSATPMTPATSSATTSATTPATVPATTSAQTTFGATTK